MEVLAMATQIDTKQREVVLVEDAHIRPMMGNQVLESLPSRHIPYSLVDPFILIHEAEVKVDPNVPAQDTTHPHRGFDNMWYAITGSSSTGHSTGPDGAFERARLGEGSLLFIRTGRGVYHAEGLGDDERREGKVTSMRGLLFWVNLARKDKNVEPFAKVVPPKDVPVRTEGDATIRVLVGDGSSIELGTPGLIFDVELPKGGKVTIPIPAGFNGLVHMLEGEANFGANHSQAKRGQIAVLGPGGVLAVDAAQPGTRFVLMAGKPYGEQPVYNGPYVD
jgi:redox-sensitive bicupin YhaK (pirin superfamily)